MKRSFEAMNEKHPNSIQVINKGQDDEAVSIDYLILSMLNLAFNFLFNFNKLKHRYALLTKQM
jgi:hypothetical protein